MTLRREELPPACPLWSQRTSSGTPASVAVVMHPRRALTPEYWLLSAPAISRPERIMPEKAEAEGGALEATWVPPLTRLKRGK